MPNRMKNVRRIRFSVTVEVRDLQGGDPAFIVREIATDVLSRVGPHAVGELDAVMRSRFAEPTWNHIVGTLCASSWDMEIE